jgi:hypothetical protein
VHSPLSNDVDVNRYCTVTFESGAGAVTFDSTSNCSEQFAHEGGSPSFLGISLRWRCTHPATHITHHTHHTVSVSCWGSRTSHNPPFILSHTDQSSVSITRHAQPWKDDPTHDRYQPNVDSREHGMYGHNGRMGERKEGRGAAIRKGRRGDTVNRLRAGLMEQPSPLTHTHTLINRLLPNQSAD